MINKRTISTAVAAALTAAALTALPGPATAKTAPGLTSFHGTVTSVSTSSKTFQISRAGGTTLTFRVTSATTFQRISGGLSGLTRGKSIEVKARKADGRWSARKVEPGTTADDHGSGDDDGADHDAGDDHGSDG
jgi:hypothetical protein